eukprot:3532205-Amphidinium_carterae.1
MDIYRANSTSTGMLTKARREQSQEQALNYLCESLSTQVGASHLVALQEGDGDELMGRSYIETSSQNGAGVELNQHRPLKRLKTSMLT